MKKTTIGLVIVILLLIVNGSVLAKASNSATGLGNGQGNKNVVENQNQIQVQNQGEEQNLQINNQENEQTNFNQGESVDNNNESSGSGIMNQVGSKIVNLEQIQTYSEKTQNQLKQMVTEQTQVQTRLKQQYDKIKSRNKLAKLLIGPDFKAVLDAKKELQQVTVQIKQLEQLKDQIYNESDSINIEETIQALNQQQTYLEDELAKEQSTFSFFGWFFKLFNKK